MKTTKINDERITAESNKVYKTCFFALCGAIFIDIILKFTTWYYWDFKPVVSREGLYISGPKVIPFYMIWGIEVLCLALIFLFCVFSLAKKGIALGSRDLERKRFPARRYAIISSIIASAVFVSIIATRIIMSLAGGGTFYSEYGFWGTVLMFLLIYALIAVPIFAFCYLIFYIAYKLAKMNLKKGFDTADSEKI